mgnify:CR=1 FL=1
MINIKDYDRYKQAKRAGDNMALEALKRAYTDDYSKYEQIYQYEQIRGYMDILDGQRREEEKYERWKNNHAYDVLNHKMPDDCFRASFRLSDTLPFYERFCKEIKEGKVR